MTWLQIVFFIILNLPKFIGIIGQLLDIIKDMPKDEKLSLKEQLVAALKHWKQTGDVSQLNQVCEGVGCATNLKRDT